MGIRPIFALDEKRSREGWRSHLWRSHAKFHEGIIDFSQSRLSQSKARQPSHTPKSDRPFQARSGWSRRWQRWKLQRGTAPENASGDSQDRNRNALSSAPLPRKKSCEALVHVSDLALNHNCMEHVTPQRVRYDTL